MGVPSSWFLCPVRLSPLFFGYVLTVNSKLSQVHAVLSSPLPEISSFSKEPGSFQGRMIFRNPNLEA